jgi:RimJ/RimL family protein N-acetyltransferase
MRTKRLVLTLPQEQDAPELLAYAIRNHEHHAPWSPPPPKDALAAESSQRLAERVQSEFESGRSVRFWLRLGQEFTGKSVGAVGRITGDTTVPKATYR